LQILKNLLKRSMRHFYPSSAGGGLRMTDAAKASSVLVTLTERADVPAHKGDGDLNDSRS